MLNPSILNKSRFPLSAYFSAKIYPVNFSIGQIALTSYFNVVLDIFSTLSGNEDVTILLDCLYLLAYYILQNNNQTELYISNNVQKALPKFS